METRELMHRSPVQSGALLLGWQTPRTSAFGFAPQRHRPKPIEQPIWYQGDGHLVTLAPTRSGKGRGVLIPNLLLYPGPAVVFDPKGELYRVTARRRREMGQVVIRLDPCEVIGPGPDTLNPFDIFNLANADIETDAQTLSEWLSLGNKGTKEPFWDLQGCGLHSGIITHLVSSSPLEKRNLEEARNLLMGEDVVYRLATLLDKHGKQMNKMAYDEIAAFLSTADVTRSGIHATALAYIKPFLGQRMGNALKNSTFSLDDVVSGKPLTIYMILPPDKLKSHRALLKLWVGTIMKAITSRSSMPTLSTLMLLDECAQLDNFPYLETLITLGAGYGAQVWTFWQDMSQLKTCYPSSWETILHNCSVLQTFGVRNRHMAEQWGTFLEHGLEELLALSSDQEVVRIQEQGEWVCRRPDYLNDPWFTGLFDDNPLYRQRRQLSGETAKMAKQPVPQRQLV